MKYKHSLQLVISSILVLFITSCEDDKINASDEFSGVSFNEESVDISVPQTGASYTVEVQTTTTYNQDLTFNLDIVEDLSDYGTSDFDMNSQVVVPAGSTVGTSTINFDWDAIAPGVVNTIVFDVTSSDPSIVDNITREYLTIDYIKECPSDLAGTYSVVSSGNSTDGSATPNPISDFAYTVDIVSTGVNTYSISDGVAGLYQEWYCVPYGYCFETEGEFTDICGNLEGAWVEAFEAEIRLTGVNNYDGTLTITWENDFGDTGSAVYTKQ